LAFVLLLAYLFKMTIDYGFIKGVISEGQTTQTRLCSRTTDKRLFTARDILGQRL